MLHETIHHQLLRFNVCGNPWKLQIYVLCLQNTAYLMHWHKAQFVNLEEIGKCENIEAAQHGIIICILIHFLSIISSISSKSQYHRENMYNLSSLKGIWWDIEWSPHEENQSTNGFLQPRQQGEKRVVKRARKGGQKELWSHTKGGQWLQGWLKANQVSGAKSMGIHST